MSALGSWNRLPNWMVEPEVARERAAEENDRICTEWEYEQERRQTGDAMEERGTF